MVVNAHIPEIAIDDFRLKAAYNHLFFLISQYVSLAAICIYNSNSN